MSTTASPTTRSGTGRTSWRIAIGAGLGVSLLVGLFAAALLWPIVTASPQNIPLAVAGPEQAVAGIEQQLAAQDEDLFEITTVDDKAAAVEAIETREVVGAIVVSDGIEILTTSAGSPQVAQMLSQMGTALSSQAGPGGQAPTVTVTDVVPAGTNGTAANLAMMPTLIGGMAAGVISILLVRTPLRRFATLATVAIAGGLVGAAVLVPWFEVLDGSYLLVASALAMGILAIGSFIAGLGTLLGRAGLGIGAALVMLIGNPWAGTFAPREFLVEPMASIGAAMPNGAIANLLRSISFFPDAATGNQWLILTIWAVVGLAMVGIGAALPRNRQQTAAHTAVTTTESVATA